MTLSTPERERADEAPATDPGREVGETLELVRGSVLRLLSGFPNPPSALRVRAGGVTVEAEWPTGAPAGPAPGTVPSTAPGPAPVVPAPAEPDPNSVPEGHRVTAPAVGVLYRSPEPGSAPFVEVGDTVTAGQQVAIVEVMKLMLPVHSDTAGEVVAVLAEDAANVEFGEPILVVRPN